MEASRETSTRFRSCRRPGADVLLQGRDKLPLENSHRLRIARTLSGRFLSLQSLRVVDYGMLERTMMLRERLDYSLNKVALALRIRLER
jgi:hypothetical protein